MIIRRARKVLTPNLIELESGDKVRLISVDDTKQVDTEENTSSDFLTKLVANKHVQLKFDKRMLDPDGNLLAYVLIKTSFTGEPVWMMINKRMIVKGYAGFRLDQVNNTYSLDLESLESIAKEEKRGIWKE
jgi:endonuclease YncB( thermonuclease family)